MAPRSNKAPRKVRERKPHVVDFILLFMVLVSVVDLYSLSCGPVWGAAFCFVKNKINETFDFLVGELGGIGGQCANLDRFSFSLCCLDCAIDEISESRRHLPLPSLDHTASQQLTHISGTAHLQFLRQPLLRDSGPAPQKLGQADFSRITPPHP